jgi:hypothetical protein
MAVPLLEAGILGLQPRPGRRVEIRQRREPVDPGDAVTGLAPSVGVEEVVGERPRVGLREAERSQAIERLGQDRTGSGLNVRRPA